MKIFVISPILPPEGEDYREQYRRRDSAQIPAEFSFAYIDKGPRFIQNAYDDACAAPDLIRKIQAAEQDGADAVVINCSADTALRACREAVSIPVIGPSECTMLYASQLVDTFTVLTFAKRINGRFYRIAQELGLSHRLAAVESVEMDFDDISNGQDKVVDKLYETIRAIHDRTGCDGYILGCTDFEDVAPQLSKRLKDGGVDVILFKPYEIAAWQAYITAKMGLRQGSASYPKPLFPISDE
ncbi:MAG: aspartate/glutamate racemase family protein [Oscillospiraceae bacterium]|nr:aspartate/glutamate racemase family protein [Oscillospiraceae bacterium]